MKEHPILFTGPMVRAILEGRKTQTRLPIKAPKGLTIGCREDSLVAFDDEGGPTCVSIKAPFAVGDRLWVRETFASFKGSGVPCSPRDASYVVMADGAQKYRSDGFYSPVLATYAPGASDGIKWRPSIHMPRWASRITLEVTAIRPERVQNITEAGARAEGLEGAFFLSAFASFWESIYGRFAWRGNPWTWATTFKVVKP